MTICLATLAFPPPFKIPNYFLMSPISPQLSTTVQRPQQQSILNYGRLLGGGGGLLLAITTTQHPHDAKLFKW